MSHVTARDRLIVALDVPTVDEAHALVRRLDGAVTYYKIGLELVMQGGLDLARELKRDGKRVFLDMKLLDISNTVERAVANAAETGVDLLTIHGHDTKTIKAAVAGRGKSRLKILAVTVLTHLGADDVREQGHALSPADLVLLRAKLACEAGCDGVVASGHEAARIRATTGDGFLIVTPGIRMPGGSAGDQERIMTPDHAISAGADYLVVGRPITQADDPHASAESFVRHIHDAHLAAARKHGA